MENTKTEAQLDAEYVKKQRDEITHTMGAVARHAKINGINLSCEIQGNTAGKLWVTIFMLLDDDPHIVIALDVEGGDRNEVVRNMEKKLSRVRTMLSTFIGPLKTTRCDAVADGNHRCSLLEGHTGEHISHEDDHG